MWKKLLVVAALAAPSAAFAADIVIRFDSPARVVHTYGRGPVFHNGYPHGHNHGHYHALSYEEQRMAAWVNQEQANQRARLEQGIRSGELTRGEAEQLLREQSNIRGLESRILADRNFTRAEFERIQDALRDANRHIYAQKSDREDRDRHVYYGYNRW